MTRKLPPQTHLNPIVSSLRFAKDPIAMTDSHIQTLGSTFRLNIGFRDVYFMGTPQAAKHVLQTHNRNYIKDRAFKQLKLIVGNGLLTNEGESWFQQRRLAQPAFYKEHLQSVFQTMQESAVSFADALQSRVGQGEQLDVHPLMMSLTMDIVLKGLFSKSLPLDFQELYNRIAWLQDFVIERIRKPYTIPFSHINGRYRKYQKLQQGMTDIVLEIINSRRRENESNRDLLSMFMDAKDEDTGEEMNNQQLIDECLTMIGAGHETSANALSWTLHLMAQHPEVWAKVRAEANAVLTQDFLPLEELSKLDYCRQVIEESMRLYPPAWVTGRQSVADDEVDGWFLPKGSLVFIPIYSIHRDPAYWDSPDEFRPERFSKAAAASRDKFHYFPFGAGPRMCIGVHFAMMEMQLVLAVLSQRLDLETVPDHPIARQALITLKPKYGIQLRLRASS